MNELRLTDTEVQRAKQLWAAYQQQHDVSTRKGQAVGIDPVTGRVWFGERAIDIARQMRAEGVDKPFYCVRVGSDYYGRKGGRR
jgi:hypothetical protein